MISTPFVSVPPRDYGGTELVIHELTEGLIARGHTVTLFATGDSHTSAELRFLRPTAEWPPDPYVDLDHVSWAMSEVASGDFDVVHVHSFAALPLERLVPYPPLVYTVHHARDERMSRLYPLFPGIQYVAISRDQARREVPLPRLTVIHHGLDPDRYQWCERPAGYVCFVGRFAREKGPHTAIDVAARAGVPILVAGAVHPPDEAFVRAEVEPRLAQPHVTWLGPVGIDRKVPLLRDALALLAPIDWHEPFGLILIEAMLSGCPVVAFPMGSVPELIEPGITGFVVRSPEEMAAVIAPGGPVHQFDRRRCHLRARRRFSRNRMVAEYERVYARVVADARARIPEVPGAPARPITAA